MPSNAVKSTVLKIFKQPRSSLKSQFILCPKYPTISKLNTGFSSLLIIIPNKSDTNQYFE